MGGTKPSATRSCVDVWDRDEIIPHWFGAKPHICTWCGKTFIQNANTKKRTRIMHSTLKTRNVWALRLGWNSLELIFVSRPLMGKKEKSQTQYPTFDPSCFVFSCHTFHYAMPPSSIHHTPLVFIGAKSANIKVPNRQFVHMIFKTPFFLSIFVNPLNSRMSTRQISKYS